MKDVSLHVQYMTIVALGKLSILNVRQCRYELKIWAEKSIPLPFHYLGPLKAELKAFFEAILSLQDFLQRLISSV